MLPALAVLPGHLLWRARMRVLSGLQQVLPPGVDVHGYAVLRTLDDGEPRSQQHLAAATGVSRTTVSTVVADLLARDLVERVRNPEDQRSYLLTRTEAGLDAVEAWGGHVDDVARHLGAGLDDAERAELVALLDRVAAPGLSDDTVAHVRGSLGFLVTRVHEQVHQDALAALRPLGLEPRHVGTMVALDATGPVPQAELARQLGLSGTRVVRLVDDLEERGLLERRRAPGDRRTHLLHLLPASRAALREGRRAAEGTVDAALAPLDASERERLTALLLRFLG